jgi:hypothetical protein
MVRGPALHGMSVHVCTELLPKTGRSYLLRTACHVGTTCTHIALSWPAKLGILPVLRRHPQRHVGHHLHCCSLAIPAQRWCWQEGLHQGKVQFQKRHGPAPDQALAMLASFAKFALSSGQPSGLGYAPLRQARLAVLRCPPLRQ